MAPPRRPPVGAPPSPLGPAGWGRCAGQRDSSSGTGLPRGKSSDALDALLAEEALGPDEQEEQGEDIREPILDAPAQDGSQIDLGQLLGGSDDEAADDGASDGGEAAE